jgi:hypothetical protein
MNAKANMVSPYLAAISPSLGTIVRVGYFGTYPHAHVNIVPQLK